MFFHSFVILNINNIQLFRNIFNLRFQAVNILWHILNFAFNIIKSVWHFRYRNNAFANVIKLIVNLFNRIFNGILNFFLYTAFVNGIFNIFLNILCRFYNLFKRIIFLFFFFFVFSLSCIFGFFFSFKFINLAYNRVFKLSCTVFNVTGFFLEFIDNTLNINRFVQINSLSVFNRLCIGIIICFYIDIFQKFFIFLVSACVKSVLTVIWFYVHSLFIHLVTLISVKFLSYISALFIGIIKKLIKSTGHIINPLLFQVF